MGTDVRVLDGKNKLNSGSLNCPENRPSLPPSFVSGFTLALNPVLNMSNPGSFVPPNRSSSLMRPPFGNVVDRFLSPDALRRSPLPCERRERELGELADENKTSSSPESESLKRDKGFWNAVLRLDVEPPPVADFPELKSRA
jgi:hypothetical protein